MGIAHGARPGGTSARTTATRSSQKPTPSGITRDTAESACFTRTQRGRYGEIKRACIYIGLRRYFSGIGRFLLCANPPSRWPSPATFAANAASRADSQRGNARGAHAAGAQPGAGCAFRPPFGKKEEGRGLRNRRPTPLLPNAHTSEGFVYSTDNHSTQSTTLPNLIHYVLMYNC